MMEKKPRIVVLVVVLVALAAAVTTIVILKSNANRKEKLATAGTLVLDTSIIDTTVQEIAADTVEQAAQSTIADDPQITEDQSPIEPVPEETQPIASDPVSQAIATGRPVVADFGQSTCIPCKKMLPILQELQSEYRGKAEILILDTRDYSDLAGSVGIRVIPTQIFYDRNGNEVYRHVGFMSKEDIVTQLKMMGVTGGN